MFIKLIISFLFITSINLSSDETVSMDSDGTVAEFNYLTVTDPASFMMALDRFDKSDCAKKVERRVWRGCKSMVASWFRFKPFYFSGI